jgi:hypothetical protein
MSKKKEPGHLPAWMDKHVRKCKAAMGLWDWRIDVSRVDDLKHKGEACLGYHTTEYCTLTSDIEYNTSLEDDSLGHDVITHEFLHVALIEPDRAFERVLDFVPKKHQKHCQWLYTEAKEHATEKLARSITPVLRGMDNKGKEE